MTKTIPELVKARGNYAAIEIINRLKQGADIDERDPESDCTGLHYACQYFEDEDPYYSYISESNGVVRMPLGDLPMVELLLKNNAAVDALDKLGHTPLYYSCMTDCPEIIMCLIKAGADVNTRDDEEISLLGHLLADSELIKANGRGILKHVDSDNSRVKANAIQILRENGAQCDGLDAMQESNLEIVEDLFGKHTYRIGRLASMVPYGRLRNTDIRIFWRKYNKHAVCKSDFKEMFNEEEIKKLNDLYKNQTEFIGTTKEWFYILNAFKIYYMEYQQNCDVMYIMDGDSVTRHKDLFQGPFEYIPKLINTDALIQYLPELVILLRNGAFDEIASGPLALPEDVIHFWSEENQARRCNEPFLCEPPSDDYKAPSEDDVHV